MECRLCGQNDLIKIHKVNDYLSGESFNILKCQACDFTQTDVKNGSPNYPPVYYGVNNNRFKSIFDKIQNILVEKNCDYSIKTTLKTGRILDIGCGSGIFLKSMAKRGWEVCGTEATAEAISFALKSSNIKPILDKNLTSPEIQINYFDLVTMWHVLEHTDQPLKYIEKIHTILNKHGYLILEVPNIKSLQAIIFNNSWFHLDVPRHINHFSVNTLTKLLRDSKFSIVRVETLSWGHGVYGWLQSTANIVFGDRNVVYKTLKMGEKVKYKKNTLKLAALLLALPLFTALEALASLLRYGAVIRITAKKVV